MTRKVPGGGPGVRKIRNENPKPSRKTIRTEAEREAQILGRSLGGSLPGSDRASRAGRAALLGRGFPCPKGLRAAHGHSLAPVPSVEAQKRALQEGREGPPYTDSDRESREWAGCLEGEGRGRPAETLQEARETGRTPEEGTGLCSGPLVSSTGIRWG